LLTAQARAEQATLVTADRTIPAYDVLTFWATD
jgi:PIN domain nuclease of toxin-antitoxin system